MTPNNRRSKLISWFIINYRFTGFLAFLLLMTIVGYATLQRLEILHQNERREMSNILSSVKQNVEQAMKNCYTTALTLALTVNDEGIPENFEDLSKKMLDSNSSIDVLQLVPDGVIKYIYPLEGNESALNLDILKYALTKKDAALSLKTKRMYFSGPTVLKQGGIGLIGRLPIFKGSKFWGFSGGIIKLHTLIKLSGIEKMNPSEYYFQFSKINPVTGKEDFFLPNKEDFSEKHFDQIAIVDGDWKIYIISKNPYSAILEILPLVFLGLIFSIVSGLFISNILKKPSELQLLVDNQADTIISAKLEFNTLFEQSSVGIINVDLDGNFIAANQQFCKILGYSPEEIKTKKFSDLTHEKDIEKNLYKLNNIKNGTISDFTLEKRYIHKNGNIVWANIHVYPLLNADKNKTSCITIVEDITEKKESEEKIRKSEIRFKSLFDDSPVALWEEDFSQVRNYLEAQNLFGKSAKEVLSFLTANPEHIKNCISLVKIININNECLVLHHPKTKKELMTGLDRVLNSDETDTFLAQLVAITQGEKHLSIDTKVMKPDGEFRDISLRWSIMRGYEETLERVIISTEDITLRKASEEIIIQSQKKIEGLVNTIDGIVWESNFDDNHFTFVNKKAAEITGYSTDEWLSNPDFWYNTMHPDDREEIMNLRKTKSFTMPQYDLEYRMIAKNGTIIWIRDIVNVFYENEKPISLKGIMIDITSNKQSEKELSDSFDLVTEQNKRLLNFSYIVSHNLRSHTSNIQAISNLIETVEDEEERIEMIEMLQKVSGALNDSMSNLNEVVNIQTNMNLIRKDLNLRQNIDKIIHILSEQVTIKKAEIHNNVDPDISVIYNPAYLESVLLNFISNALRYSHPDRIPVITIDSGFENGKTILKISDNGMGIDLQKYGSKLFGMYKTFHENPDSKGIGLFITKNQIDAMGGTVKAESEPNVGSTFIISFK